MTNENRARRLGYEWLFTLKRKLNKKKRDKNQMSDAFEEEALQLKKKRRPKKVIIILHCIQH